MGRALASRATVVSTASLHRVPIRNCTKVICKTKMVQQKLLCTPFVMISLAAAAELIDDCRVVVVGGSIAALSAAVTSAKEGVETCLIAPTSFVGGQMTANGIPALDFMTENGRLPFNTSAATPDTWSVNQPRDFTALVRSIHPVPNYHNTCWVSPYCFLPTAMEGEGGGIHTMIASAGSNLRVFRNTVLLNATTMAAAAGGSQSRRVMRVIAVQRTSKASAAHVCRRLSESMPDWYSTTSSAFFDKRVLSIRADHWVDASYNGELLLLAGAPYLQGIDEAFDGDNRGTAGNDTIGQAFTMTFHVQLLGQRAPPEERRPAMFRNGFPPMEANWSPDPFRASPAIHTPTHKLDWESLWTRRRSYAALHNPSAGATNAVTANLGMDPPQINNVSLGDVHLAAWPDYHYGYLFLSKEQAAFSVQAGDGAWTGGYDLHSIERAERYSYGAFEAYSARAPPMWRNRTQLNSTFLGTCHGLAQLPYVRDGRRSVGIDGFVLNLSYVHSASKAPPDDCIAIVGSGCDIWGHRMMEIPVNNTAPGIAKCAPADRLCNAYPQYMRIGGSTGLTCVPLRALTSARLANVVPAGYAMAQSFMVNAALRMHREEFAIGVGAGAVSAHMAHAQLNSTEATLQPKVRAAIQERIRSHAPLTWTTNMSNDRR